MTADRRLGNNASVGEHEVVDDQRQLTNNHSSFVLFLDEKYYAKN